MPYKDRGRARTYQREYQRLRRAGQPPGARGIEAVRSSNHRTDTAVGLLGVLSHLIGQVLHTDEGDVFIRSRTCAYLISVGLKAIETAEFESRLNELEKRVFGGTNE